MTNSKAHNTSINDECAATFVHGLVTSQVFTAWHNHDNHRQTSACHGCCHITNTWKFDHSLTHACMMP